MTQYGSIVAGFWHGIGWLLFILLLLFIGLLLFICLLWDIGLLLFICLLLFIDMLQYRIHDFFNSFSVCSRRVLYSGLLLCIGL